MIILEQQVIIPFKPSELDQYLMAAIMKGPFTSYIYINNLTLTPFLISPRLFDFSSLAVLLNTVILPSPTTYIQQIGLIPTSKKGLCFCIRT